MTTINVSSEAYKQILQQKQEIEEEVQGIVSISMAVDALLGVDAIEVMNKR